MLCLPHMKSRCFQRTESCLFRFLSPSCFYSTVCGQSCAYLSRAFVKSLGNSYLECKNTELEIRQRQRSLATIYKMLETLICISWCSSSLPVQCPDLLVYFQGHSVSVETTLFWICIQAEKSFLFLKNKESKNKSATATRKIVTWSQQQFWSSLMI